MDISQGALQDQKCVHTRAETNFFTGYSQINEEVISSKGKLGEPVIALGSKVSYKAISSKDESRLHQFGNKLLTGSGETTPRFVVRDP